MLYILAVLGFLKLAKSVQILKLERESQTKNKNIESLF